MQRAVIDSPDVCRCVLCREWIMTSDLIRNGAYIEDEYGPDVITACSMCCERSHAERVVHRERLKCCFCDSPAKRDIGDPGFPVPCCDPCDDQLNAWASRTFDKPHRYLACQYCGVRDKTVRDAMWDDNLPTSGNWCYECVEDMESGMWSGGPSHSRWAAYEERKANA